MNGQTIAGHAVPNIARGTAYQPGPSVECHNNLREDWRRLQPIDPTDAPSTTALGSLNKIREKVASLHSRTVKATGSLARSLDLLHGPECEKPSANGEPMPPQPDNAIGHLEWAVVALAEQLGRLEDQLARL